MAKPGKKKMEAPPIATGRQPVLIELKGNENATSNRTDRDENGVAVIRLSGGERVTWKKDRHSNCTVTFTQGGCAFIHRDEHDHQHDHGQCRFTISADQKTRSGDVVRGSKNRKVFVFTVEFDTPDPNDHSGTPQIIVQG